VFRQFLADRRCERVITVVGDGNARYMFYAGLGIVGLGLLRGLAGFLARYYSEKLSHYIAFDIRNDMYQKVLNLPFSYHDHAHVGTIVTRAIADVGEVQRFYAYGIMDLLNVGLLTLGTLAVMFYISPLLATIALIPLLPLIPLSQRFAEAVDPEWKQIMERTQTLSNHLQETAIGAQVVRVFAREDYEVGRFYGDNKTLYHNFMDLIGRWATFLPLSAFIASLSTVSLLVVGGWLESRGQGGVTAGLLVTFNAFVLQLANPLRFLGFVILLVTQAASSSERVFEILDAPQDISSKPDAQAMGQAAGQVTFENVNLTYPGERHPALKRINFTAMPGQVIGIVGATGAGKSSVVSLIPRFYDVTEGRVLIDGLDVRNIELNSLRANVGNVLQTSLLFSATIGENIAYGRVNATHEQIVAAAKAGRVAGLRNH
jgi:ABC-type multidrug transport system fused ATPase/permease subunit